MRNLAIALRLTCLAVLAFCSQTFAQTQDDLFNGDILHEIRLYIAPEDYVTFKQTNFTCQTQDLEALAGEVISPLPRVVCHFRSSFIGNSMGPMSLCHRVRSSRMVREAEAITNHHSRSISAATRAGILFWA